MITVNRGKKAIIIALIIVSAIAFLFSGLAVAGNISKNNKKPVAATEINLADYSNVSKSVFSTYYSKEGAYFYIEDIADLDFFSKTMGEWDFNYSSMHVYLCADLNLNGRTMYPIGFGLDESTTDEDDYNFTPFAGFFYGQGHTIENFTITLPLDSSTGRIKGINGYYISAGFFGQMTDISTISELRLNNININIDSLSETTRFDGNYGGLYVGGIVGVHTGSDTGVGEISKCAVEDLSVNIAFTKMDPIDCVQVYIGGITGCLGDMMSQVSEKINLRHCYVENFKMNYTEYWQNLPYTNYGSPGFFCGGIVGFEGLNIPTACVFNGTHKDFTMLSIDAGADQDSLPNTLLYTIGPDWENCYVKTEGEKVFESLRKSYPNNAIWFFDADYNDCMPYLYCFLDLNIYNIDLYPQGKGYLEYKESDLASRTEISGTGYAVKLPKDFEPEVYKDGDVYHFGNYKTITAVPYDSYYIFYEYQDLGQEEIDGDTQYNFKALFVKEYCTVILEVSEGLTLGGGTENIAIHNIKVGSIVNLKITDIIGYITVKIMTDGEEVSYNTYIFDVKRYEVSGYKINSVSKSKDLTEYEITEDTSIVPILKTRTNKINYYLDGGTNHPSNPSSYNYDSSAITLKNPTQTGYTFKHWATSWGGQAASTPHIPQNSYGDKTFYAVWEVITYNITYELDGGTNDSYNKTTYTVEDSIMLYKPTKEGYTFKGWLDSSGNIVSSIPKGSIGNKKFTAQWGPLEYTITYYLKGGINHQANPTIYTYEDEIILQNPTREHYDFNGWYLNYSCDEPAQIPQISKGSTGNKTFYAKWTPTEYTITYNLDGGQEEAGKENPTKYTVESARITLNNPVKEGYIFTGWTGTEVTELTKTVTIPAGSTGDRAYLAHWVDAYTVTFKWVENCYLNEGVGNTTGEGVTDVVYSKVYPNEKITIEQVYSFYGFTGVKVLDNGTTNYVHYVWDKAKCSITAWNINGEICSSDTNIEYIVEQDTIIMPILEVNSYMIGYDLYYSGVDNSMNPGSYTAFDEITLEAPIKEGYEFKGWYLSYDYEELAPIPHIPLGSTGSKYFYAKWEPVEYTITYNLEGGELPEDKTNPTTYTVETSDITLNNPTKTGAFFAGWIGTGLEEPTLGVKISRGSVGNREYTATWTDAISVTYKWVENTYLNEGQLNRVDKGTTDLTYTQIEPYSELNIITSIASGNVSLLVKNDGKNQYVTYIWDVEKYTITGLDINGQIVSAEDTKYGLEYAYAISENIEVVPILETKVFEIKYQLISGADNSMNPATYTCEDVIILENPIKEGYNFDGWYLDYTDDEPAAIPQIPLGSTGAKTFYAKWTPTVYTITYNLNGATDPGNPTTYTIETSIFTLKNPSKPYFEFVGWQGTDIEDKSSSVTIRRGSTGDREYTALFVDNRYKVGFKAEGVDNVQIKVIKNGQVDYLGSEPYIIENIWNNVIIEFTINKATNTYRAQIKDAYENVYIIEYVLEAKYTLDSFFVSIEGIEMIISENQYVTTADCEIIARFVLKSYGVEYN